MHGAIRTSSARLDAFARSLLPTMPAATPGRRLAAVIAAALAVHLALAARFDFVCDDAYISFRYARHLAEGSGLTFNPGESPPVEGFSNLLWVLWMSLFEVLGVAPEAASRVTSVLCGAVLIALVARFLHRRFPADSRPALAGALCLAAMPPFAVWSTGGLETMAFALACFAAFERLSLDPHRPRGVAAGLCAAAAALLRADGAMWAFAMIAVAALPIVRGGGAVLRRQVLIAAAIVALVTIAQFDWRHEYFGEWLPNTARVKTGMSSLRLGRGFDYVATFLLVVPLAAAVPVAAAVARGGAAPLLALQSAAVFAVACAYSVTTGGDFMPMGRFLVVAMPFVAVLFAIVFERFARHRAAWPVAGACLVSLVLASFDVPLASSALADRFHFRGNRPTRSTEVEMWRESRDNAAEWKALGRALSLTTKPGESIVFGNVGAIGYETELKIHDLYGLVSPEVARREARPVRASPGHDHGVSPEFFFAQKPTYLTAYLLRPGDTPVDGPPPGWTKATWESKVEIVVKPLPPGQGFDAGTEVHIFKLKW